MDDLSEYESGFSKPIEVPVNQTKSVLFYDLKTNDMRCLLRFTLKIQGKGNAVPLVSCNG